MNKISGHISPVNEVMIVISSMDTAFIGILSFSDTEPGPRYASVGDPENRLVRADKDVRVPAGIGARVQLVSRGVAAEDGGYFATVSYVGVNQVKLNVWGVTQ